MKGYIVLPAATGDIQLVETKIQATVVPDRGGGNTCALDSMGIILWSMKNREVGTKTYIGNRGKWNCYEDGTSLRDDVLMSLDAAKKVATELADSMIKSLTDKIKNCQESLQGYQSLDLDTFPKDEYLSPFTGKKV